LTPIEFVNAQMPVVKISSKIFNFRFRIFHCFYDFFRSI